jgi:alkanesulfonate monooxygenase
MADHSAVLNMPVNALAPHGDSFEPFTPLRWPAPPNIGLIATGSTTFDEPYHVARRFASSITSRAARRWNIVTTSIRRRAEFRARSTIWRRQRAGGRATWRVVTGLWDAFADACARRRARALFRSGQIRADHKGKYLSVRAAQHRRPGAG